MAIPEFEQTMLPLLRCIENGKDWEMSEIESWSVKHFGLSKAERTELKTSGNETLFHNRLHWAKLYLKRADLVVDISRSLVKITKEGLSALKQKPEKIDIKFLKQYTGFLEWYTRKKPKGIAGVEEITLSGYDLDESNAKKIDDYIQKHPDCELKKTYPLKLRGVREDLPVYSLPLDLLFYNIRNGRFAMEYGALKAKEGHELRTEDSADAKKIQKLLLDIDPKHTLYLVNDIKKMRQTEPGVITIGGYILNGNRRMAVLQNLVEQGDSSFGYLEAARLPGKVSPIDVWKIEAGIQLSREKQLDYDPINVLLKFEEGLNSGLSSMEMAKSLYGGFKEKDIVEKLQQLKLIVQYLRFIECPKQFHRVKSLDTHFIEIRKNVLNAQKRGLSAAEITDIKLIGFQLIFDGISHKELRKIDKIVVDEEIKEEFWKALDYSKAESLAKKDQVRKDSEDKDALTPAREIFTECVDFVKIKTEKKQPTKLLKNALKNLENIERKKSSFASPESITLIGDIVQVVKKLNAVVEGTGK